MQGVDEDEPSGDARLLVLNLSDAVLAEYLAAHKD